MASKRNWRCIYCLELTGGSAHGHSKIQTLHNEKQCSFDLRDMTPLHNKSRFTSLGECSFWWAENHTEKMHWYDLWQKMMRR